jgi:quercetin dioxygenase-like cupin family protein
LIPEVWSQHMLRRVVEARGAIAIALSVAGAALAQSDTAPLKITRNGSQAAVRGPSENFTGAVRVDMRFAGEAPARVSGGQVTFDPGARTAWHTHPLGQMLIVTSGVGLVQRWGEPAQEIRPGDVVWIPPAVKHWHGAAPGSAMSHIAIAEALDGKTVDWLEKVTDAQYRSF